MSAFFMGNDGLYENSGSAFKNISIAVDPAIPNGEMLFLNTRDLSKSGKITGIGNGKTDGFVVGDFVRDDDGRAGVVTSTTITGTSTTGDTLPNNTYWIPNTTVWPITGDTVTLPPNDYTTPNRLLAPMQPATQEEWLENVRRILADMESERDAILGIPKIAKAAKAKKKLAPEPLPKGRLILLEDPE